MKLSLKKKKNITQCQELDQSQNLISFTEISNHIIREVGGEIYIGDEKITPNLLNAIKDEAQNIKTMNLYEIIVNTLKDEASNLALIQSKDWNNVQFAKALWYTQKVLVNIIDILTKD